MAFKSSDHLLNLDTPICQLFMVGNQYGKRLINGLGIKNVKDLLYHFPARYEDLSFKKTISQLQDGEKVTLEGQILTIKNLFTRSGKQIQKCLFSDGKQTLNVTWFNQPYLIKTLAPGTKVNLAGKVKKSLYQNWELVSPQFEIIKNRPGQTITNIHTGRLVPIYPETYGLSSKWLRSRIKSLLPFIDAQVTDWLPEEIIKKEKLLTLPEALKKIHFPKDNQDVIQSRKRLGFDELLILQLKSLYRKNEWQKLKLKFLIKPKNADLQSFIKNLPFKLTDDQKKAIDEIVGDLAQNKPMNRLLEGDVGVGKTVVAAAAIYLTYKCGYKSIFMVPTEVLANQHFKTLNKLFKNNGLKIGFFTKSKKPKLPLKNYHLFLGTHALLHQQLTKEPIGLLIIDEQHRFGVEQRAKLAGKKQVPHVLTMTATPIPRTIALTLYGDLDLSIINSSPVGRKKIKTWVVPQNKRKAGMTWIEKEMKKHHTQAYFIYPLIDHSNAQSMNNTKAAKEEFNQICQLFPDFSIGLLHGRMKAKEKSAIMNQFISKKLDILVSTSVIEVGIDVTNASIIVIEGAERFGLAQLHQLRGRVGRGEKQSYCLIFTSKDSQSSLKRLKALETLNSGLALAQLDYKIRGSGEIFGTLQSGYADCKIASLSDTALVNQSRLAAKNLLSQIDKYPDLKKRLKNLTIHDIKPN